MGKSVMFQTLRRRPEVVAKYRVLAKSPFFRDLGKDPWSAPVKSSKMSVLVDSLTRVLKVHVECEEDVTAGSRSTM